MALFDRFRNQPKDGKRKVEKTYEDTITRESRVANTSKTSKGRRRLLIGLGIAAAITTVMFPFAIGLAVTTAGATGVALGGTAVLLGGAAIGCGVGLIGAVAWSKPKRVKGASASRNEKGKFSKEMSTSETKNMLSSMRERINDDALINAETAKMTAEATKRGIAFTDDMDPNFVEKWMSGPLTEDEVKLLQAAAKAANAKAAKDAKAGKTAKKVDFVKKFEKGEKLTDKEMAWVEKAATYKEFEGKTFDMEKRFEVNSRKFKPEDDVKAMTTMRPCEEAARGVIGGNDGKYRYPIEIQKITIKTADGKETVVEFTDVEATSLGSYKVYEQQLAHIANNPNIVEATMETHVTDPTVKNQFQVVNLKDYVDEDGKARSCEKGCAKVLGILRANAVVDARLREAETARREAEAAKAKAEREARRSKVKGLFGKKESKKEAKTEEMTH